MTTTDEAQQDVRELIRSIHEDRYLIYGLYFVV
jgi:hypothetical protein